MQFGQRSALQDVSFSLGSGVTGILGPNGAGKTTTLRLVAGFMAPGLGTVSVLGGNPLSKEIRRDIGYLPEGAPLPPDLTVGEILDFTCRMRGIRRMNRSLEISRVMQLLALAALRYRNAEALSKGQRRRVALAAALIGDPRVLVLDEPTDGLDPSQRDEVHDMIRQWSPDRAVLISTHILDEAERLCDQALILSHGSLMAQGKPFELIHPAGEHESVRIELFEPGDAGRFGQRLRTLDSVLQVESTARPETLLVRGRVGESTFAEITGLISREGWAVRAIYHQSTRLEDVFKALTLADQAK